MTAGVTDLSRICPCCGAPVRVDRWAAALAILSPQQRRIVEIVQRRPGLMASEISAAVYAHRRDGGPLSADVVTRKLISRANRRLTLLGFSIVAGQGSRDGYKITFAPYEGGATP